MIRRETDTDPCGSPSNEPQTLYFNSFLILLFHFMAAVGKFFCNLHGFNLVTFLNWTPLCEWYMARFVVKHEPEEDLCSCEI